MASEHDQWLNDLNSQVDRVLTEQDDDTNVAPWDQERCVICNSRTTLWLQPENAPICSDACLDRYTKDPSVYDPRGLHGERTPAIVAPEPKPPKRKRRRRSKPGRWEPSDADIAAMQSRVAEDIRKKRK